MRRKLWKMMAGKTCSDLFQESAGGFHKTDAFRQFAVAGLLLANGMSSIGQACQADAGLGQERSKLRGEAANFNGMLFLEQLQRFPGIVQRIVPCAALAAKKIALLACQHIGHIMVCAEMMGDFHG